jgi:hypothetical protein
MPGVEESVSMALEFRNTCYYDAGRLSKDSGKPKGADGIAD